MVAISVIVLGALISFVGGTMMLGSARYLVTAWVWATIYALLWDVLVHNPMLALCAAYYYIAKVPKEQFDPDHLPPRDTPVADEAAAARSRFFFLRTQRGSSFYGRSS